ncbi:hypothetical protein HLPCO_001792 [Haloplasma contractile SSD-17B]|uniref:Uncharacterized protein n=1 Tax=Haloplasma contractile SSD-17B TaxID=1033810 RepID=F7PTU7_9MOLU|nr:hypothetical protein HLPCO_001792 [Haloplasma contractile SSD-17B]
MSDCNKEAKPMSTKSIKAILNQDYKTVKTPIKLRTNV